MSTSTRPENTGAQQGECDEIGKLTDKTAAVATFQEGGVRQIVTATILPQSRQKETVTSRNSESQGLHRGGGGVCIENNRNVRKVEDVHASNLSLRPKWGQ